MSNLKVNNLNWYQFDDNTIFAKSSIGYRYSIEVVFDTTKIAFVADADEELDMLQECFETLDQAKQYCEEHEEKVIKESKTKTITKDEKKLPKNSHELYHFMDGQLNYLEVQSLETSDSYIFVLKKE